MRIGNGTKYATKIGGHGEITPVFQIFYCQRRHISMYFAAIYPVANDKITRCPTMIGSSRPILMYRPAKLRHRHYRDIVLVGIEVLPESRNTIAEICDVPRKDAIVRPLIEMRIPTIRLGKSHFQSHIHLDQLRDLLQRIAQRRCRIYRPRRRLVITNIGLLQ